MAKYLLLSTKIWILTWVLWMIITYECHNADKLVSDQLANPQCGEGLCSKTFMEFVGFIRWVGKICTSIPPNVESLATALLTIDCTMTSSSLASLAVQNHHNLGFPTLVIPKSHKIGWLSYDFLVVHEHRLTISWGNGGKKSILYTYTVFVELLIVWRHKRQHRFQWQSQ